MATRRVRRKHNQTRKQKNKTQVKKGGSVQCTYDKTKKTLNIIMARVMLEENLYKIKSVCEKVINDVSPKKTKTVAVAASEKTNQKSTSTAKKGH